MSLFSLEGRVVVVTGGLGQLGRQFTGALTSAGAKVAVFDLSPRAGARGLGGGAARSGPNEQQSAAPQPSPLAAAPGDNVMFVEADVTNRASLEAALRRVEEHWGVPHALINNAALDSPPGAPIEENGPFESYPEKSFDRVMEVNVKGVLLCCQVVGGRMAEEGRGSIVNISSIYGVVSPNQSIYEYRRKRGEQFYKPVAYSVSKSALMNLTRYLATYWAGKGVRVNTLTFAGVYNKQDEEFLAAYTAHVPLGRMARADEYNGAVVFLVSDAASYMTGSNLVIDGGWTAW